MNRKLLILKTGLFLLLLVTMFAVLTWVFARKESTEKYQPFYEAEENFDVLFFGTSHGANGFSPMELWKNYGIVSYNLSQHSEYPAVTYWKVLDALQYTEPSLIVVDTYLAATDTKLPEPKDYSYVHKSLDGMPFSLLKLKAVCDLVPDLNHRAEFLWNFVMYHNRYNDLDIGDFHPEYSVEKGGESRVGVLSLGAPSLVGQDQLDEREWLLELTGFQYLQKIIDVCKERKIPLLFVNLPYFCDENDQKTSNSMKVWCESQKVGYLNLFYKEGLIDFSTDLYDYGHLNPAGYGKVNDYLGQYISENYNVPDRREDAEFAHWNKDYQTYVNHLGEKIRETDNLFVYLMMLQNENFGYTVTVNSASGALHNPYLNPFWKALGAETEAVGQDTLFLVGDGGTAASYVNPSQLHLDTSFGQISYTCEDEVTQTMNVNDMDYISYRYEPIVQFVVYNRLTKEQVDSAVFSLQEEYQRVTE